MSEYQINRIIETYFETLLQKGINEKEVKDMYQKEGILHIVLDDKRIVKEPIKNFNN